MDDREKTILQGAQNAWPQAISISQYRLRQVADRLAENDLLEKRPFAHGQAGYQITAKGRDQLLERNSSIHARNIDKAKKVLRQSPGIKPPKFSAIRTAIGPAAVIPLTRRLCEKGNDGACGCIALSVGIGTEEFYGPVHADFVVLMARDFEIRSTLAARLIFECGRDFLS